MIVETKIPTLKYSLSFHLTHQHHQARSGVIHTPHGDIMTPAFCPCATGASIKGLATHYLEQCSPEAMLINTYHMMLRPGAEKIARLGGAHRFMGWSKPLISDSGGFQAFSLGYGSVADEIKRRTSLQKTLRNNVKLSEEGIRFASHLDGSKHYLTPERSIEIQTLLGVDIALVLDECTPFHIDYAYTQAAMERTHRWGERCLAAFYQLHGEQPSQALYGIIQGGIYRDLRVKSASIVQQQQFAGYAIGGSLGATKQQMREVVAMTTAMLEPSKPRHLLGIGGIEDIIEAAQHGIDTFDCVHPTRIARHGGAIVPAAVRKNMAEKQAAISNPKRLLSLPSKREHINLHNQLYSEQDEPLDDSCSCSTCTHYSKAYLHHLFKSKEIAAAQALVVHNIYTMNRLMADIRQAIAQQNWQPVYDTWL